MELKGKMLERSERYEKTMMMKNKQGQVTRRFTIKEYIFLRGRRGRIGRRDQYVKFREVMSTRCMVEKYVPMMCMVEETAPRRGVVEEFAPRRSANKRVATYPSNSKRTQKRHSVSEEERKDEDEN